MIEEEERHDELRIRGVDFGLDIRLHEGLVHKGEASMSVSEGALASLLGVD